MMSPPPAYVRAMLGRLALRLVPIALVITLWINGHAALAIALFATVFSIIAYVTLSPSTRLLGPVVTHVPQTKGVLITIDDGPHPDTTPALLDLLDRFEAKAVFFLIGDRVKQWPHLAQEIARRGHTIGNHSQTHPAARFWSFGPWRTWREIVECQASLQAVLGNAPTWFRAPVGHFNLSTHPVLARLGLRLMSWSCRGFDGVDQDVQRVLTRIEPDLQPEAIVLLHEGQPTSAAVLEGTLLMMRGKQLPATHPRQLV